MCQVTEESKVEIRCAALLSPGRINPCLSAAVAFFMRRYHEVAPQVKLIAYRHGFRGLLNGETFTLGEEEREVSDLLIEKGGSPIGGSRVRLTNASHLNANALIKDGDDPYDVCARNLKKDGVDVLHVMGSSSAHKSAHKLAVILQTKYNYRLGVVGLPKTIENDIAPIKMCLGALTAAEQGAMFFANVVAEHNANPRMLIIHEIKGRSAGWLTAATSFEYRRLLQKHHFAPALGLANENYDIHAVYTPEMTIDFPSEISRLRRCMDRCDNVNIFLAQGTFKDTIESEQQARGKQLQKHVTLGYNLTDPSSWLAAKIKSGIGAEKILIQKSGIYVRAAPPGRRDVVLAQGLVNHAVLAALRGQNGVVGHDENYGGQVRVIEDLSLNGRKPFNLMTHWFMEMMASIGQPQPLSKDSSQRIPLSISLSKL